MQIINLNTDNDDDEENKLKRPKLSESRSPIGNLTKKRHTTGGNAEIDLNSRCREQHR